MTVAKYARNFDDLCRFSKICQGNPADFEEWKCLKFEGGLRDDLMSSIVSLEIRNFAELVNKSKLVEECIKKETVAKVSHQGFPPRRLSNHQAAGRRVHFKARGIRQHKNLQVGNITARCMGKNGVREAAVAAARAVERLGVRMETRMNMEKIMGMMRTT
ncbi:uncharacterized protein LOC107607243 [Arachis ipaensis]|uniref:uncharacterized protein LOC107607243 n=1 Tax=Arachis ipaensis TaxID=130454 RepID=UPI0007AF28A5|nr:uncharacterized protein LOC107607243 [Arachis ipaensis]